MSIEGRPAGTPVEWMTIHEAASLMGVSPATLRRWSDAGDIRTFTTPGGHRRFSRSAIADLLPADAPVPSPNPDRLEATRGRMLRSVHRASRRIAADASWSAAVAVGDRVAFAALGQQMVEGIVTALDGTEPDSGERARVTARRAATACGDLAARRGISLRQTVETCLRLRMLVVRELVGAARRHDLDAAVSTRWLEDATREIDGLVMEVMRGHETSA